MNADALVYCLLDAEGAYVPDGYTQLAAARAGDYELKLWQGMCHVGGKEVKFNEVSLNAAGRSFDPRSQATRYAGSSRALGKRNELLTTVAGWIKKYGDLYIGSYESTKLAVYHKLFRHYLPQLDISAIHAPFDECAEDGSRYFRVSASSARTESLLEGVPEDTVDPQAEVKRYADFRDNVKVMAHLLLKRGHGFNIDATPWFKLAEDDALLSLVRCKFFSHPVTRQIGRTLSKIDEHVAWAIKEYGLEDVRVNEEDAVYWIKANRPHLMPEVEQLLRESVDGDPAHYVATLTPVSAKAYDEACREFDHEVRTGAIFPENVNEVCDTIVGDIVQKYSLGHDETSTIEAHNQLLWRLQSYISRYHPEANV